MIDLNKSFDRKLVRELGAIQSHGKLTSMAQVVQPVFDVATDRVLSVNISKKVAATLNPEVIPLISATPGVDEILDIRTCKYAVVKWVGAQITNNDTVSKTVTGLFSISMLSPTAGNASFTISFFNQAITAGSTYYFAEQLDLKLCPRNLSASGIRLNDLSWVSGGLTANKTDIFVTIGVDYVLLDSDDDSNNIFDS